MQSHLILNSKSHSLLASQNPKHGSVRQDYPTYDKSLL